MDKSYYWCNRCDHPYETKVGTFIVDAKVYELYLFTSCNEQEVCIRYGHLPNEYLSPGTLQTFLITCNVGRNQIHNEAFKLLLKHFNFTAQRKPS